MPTYIRSGGTWVDVGGNGGGSSASIPSGSRTIFFQASAPTGWTKITTYNDKALRVVSGTSGGTIAGITPFSSIFPSSAVSPISLNIIGLTVGSTTLDTTMIPSHAHPVNAGGNALRPGAAGTPASPGTLAVSPGTTTGNTGGGLGHAHPVTYDSASSSFASTIDLRVQYMDFILCSKD